MTEQTEKWFNAMEDALQAHDVVYERTRTGALYKTTQGGAVTELVEPGQQIPETAPEGDMASAGYEMPGLDASAAWSYMMDKAEQTEPEMQETITVEQMAATPEIVSDAMKMYELFEDKPFQGTADELIDYAVNVQADFMFNIAGIPGAGTEAGGAIAQAAYILGKQDPEKAEAFLNFMAQYEKLPTFTSAGVSRAFRSIFTDPTTYAGIASAGAGLFGRKVAQEGAKVGIKQALRQLARPAEFAAKRPIAASALAGAGYSEVGELTKMAAETGAGQAPSALEAGIRGTVAPIVGATAGAGIAKGGQIAGQAVGEIAAPLLDMAGNVIEAAGEQAKKQLNEGGTKLMSGPDLDTPINKAVAAAGDAVKAMRANQSHPGRISTRQPSEKAALDNPEADPINNQLTIGLKEAKASGEKAFNHNIQQFQKSVNMTEQESTLPPDEAAEAFIEHLKNNLLWLFNKVPEKTRQRSKLWYDGARKLTEEWSSKYNVPDASIAGILAALSPQKDWYQNVSLGQRVLDILTTKTNVPFDKKMEAKAKEVFPGKSGLIDLLKGKTLDELETTQEKALWLRFYDEVYNSKDYNILMPEGSFGGKVYNEDGTLADMAWGTMNTIEKAINSFYSNGDRATLSRLMGERHKVRNFYNNILDPNGIYGDVTVDTHAVAAATLRPLSASSYDVFRAFGTAPTKKQQAKLNIEEGANWEPAKSSAITGQRGTYAFYAEAYRRAAAEVGLLPRELQSITWEAVRGLFTPNFKQDKKNVKMIRDIWQRYRKGEIGIDDARDQIEQAANKIDPPSWE